MAMKLKPALQTSEGRSLPWSGSRLVNAYAEMAEGDKTDAYAIMAIPGLDVFSDISASAVRGMHRMGAVLYAVVGTTLYSIDAAGVETSLGTVGGMMPVRMTDNGLELGIVGGALGTTAYVYSGGVLYTGIINLPPVSDIVYIDGFFLWTLAGSDQFIISSLNDGLTYDALDVSTVEGSPDNLVGVITDHREVLFPGADTIEVWYNSGAADFPFERQGNAFIERGCIDRDSLSKIDNGVHFVGNDLIVYRLEGYSPVRISTHAIEFRIATATYFRSFVYTQEGHKFYGLNTDQGTFCYDMATGAWAERQSFEKVNYRVSCAETAYGRTFFGDAYTGKIYTPSLDSYDENGVVIPVVVEIPTIEAARERVTLYMFELYCETGVGNAAAPDPQVIMEYSRDGGRTWSNQMARSLGAVGAYTTRAVWRPNVQFRTLAIRLTITDPTRRFVMGYFADVR